MVVARCCAQSSQVERTPWRETADDDIDVLRRIDGRFSARDIGGVLAVRADDVAWDNGMDGGRVHGHEAVRAYWTRQRSMVSPHTEPLGFQRADDGAIIAEVRQSVRDLEGRPLKGLTDKAVERVFRLRQGGVTRFGIREGV